jgi:hypothetical protein
MKRNQTLMGITSLVILSSCGLGFFLAPSVNFSDSESVSAPDYQKLSSWAAHALAPAKTRLTPPGFEVASAPEADVFFVHPTAWMSRTQWNADFKPGPAREIVDQISMGSQASVFNACCQIFAPRYRQATLGAFYAPQVPAQASFEIAYQDVARAFVDYLKDNPKRPFILAGHSQGSLHLMRLIQEKIANTPLQKRFVVGYLPGIGLPSDWYENETLRKAGIVPCNSPTQTGCVAAWDTYREGAEVQGQEPVYYWRNASLSHLPPDQARQCTNPITWQSHTQPSQLSAHMGAVAMSNTGNPFAFQDIVFSQKPLGINITGLKPPRKGLTRARCDGSALRVADLSKMDYPVMETQSGNYHLLDYELFWSNLRENVQQRIQAWKSQTTVPA